MTRLALVSAAIASAALTACTSSGAADRHETRAARSGPVVTIHATSQLRFRPSILNVTTRTIRVRFVDTSSYPHNLRVPALQFTSPTVDGGIGGTTSTTFTLRFPHPGTYPFICTYHSAAGMRGQFIVGAG